jgi:hypothetical protein
LRLAATTLPAMARKVHRAKSFSYDLLADWRPHAVPPDHVRNVRGWTYQGTVTLEGVTGALAHRRGWFGIAIGSSEVHELGMWERIRIGDDIRSRSVPGWETAPTYPEVHPTLAPSA